MGFGLTGVIVLIAILIVVLLWINISAVRTAARHDENEQVAPSERESAPVEGASSTSAAMAGAAENSHAAGYDGAAPVSQADTGSVAGAVAHGASGTDPVAVEVVQSETDAKQRMFSRSAYRFRIYETQAPMFADVNWKRCFQMLTDDPRVLGWIAFDGDTLGASDREYDAAFLEVLRTYRRSLEKLRKEVGLTRVTETSVVGEEGKIWFLAAVDDAWIALFLDHQTDSKALAESLLLQVRGGE